MFLTKTYEVEDCYFYDDATTDNTSKYTTSAISSFTQDTDHYIATKTMASASATNYYAHLYPTDIADLPSDYEFSIDLKVNSKGSDFQSGLQVSDSHITTYQYMNELSNLLRQSDLGIFYRVNGTLTRHTGNHILSTSVWYRLTFKVEGTSVNAVVTNLDSSSVVFSETKTLSNVTGWHKSQLAFGGQTQTLHFKNLKVKPL